MKLFLASEAKQCWKEINDFVGGLSGKRVLYIPTAANGEIDTYPHGSWRKGDTWAKINSTGAVIDLLELDAAIEGDLKVRVMNSDIVWMAGGMCGYLMYWIKRRKLDEILPEALDKDLIYIGSSAGSMITAETFAIAETEERGANLFDGLGYIDFDFLPHYEESMLPLVKEQYKGKKLYMVKNGEAITVVDGKVTVLGEERIYP